MSLLGIFQLRPTFHYMEKGSKRKKESEEKAENDEEQAGPSSAQQVTVRFKSTDDRWKKNSTMNYKSLLAKSAEEPWKEYSWHDHYSTFSGVCVKCICQSVIYICVPNCLSTLCSDRY